MLLTTPMTWKIRDRVLELARPIVVGILNVTPDSFSDGGQHRGRDEAMRRVEEMLREGADVIDVGGESTRPNAQPVDAREELARIDPVIRDLRDRFPDAVISVDTVKGEVARAALDAGAHVINDVSGGRLDDRMTSVVAEYGAGYIVMHSRGAVSDMARYEHATYGDDVAGDVLTELRGCVDRAIAAGVDHHGLIVDPGLGFAKRSEHSVALLAAIPQLASWGFPVLVGASRKRFVGEIAGEPDPSRRVHATTGANVAALSLGARLFRVHDIAAARQALDVAWAVFRAAEAPRAALESVT